MALTLDTDTGLFTRLGTVMSAVEELTASVAVDDRELLHGAQAFAERLLIETVNEEYPLTDRSVEPALKALIDDMIANAETVLENTVTAAVTAGAGNTGTGTMIASVLRPDGGNWMGLSSEEAQVICTVDGQRSPDLAGNEYFRVKGQAVRSRTSRNWPLDSGSGVNKSFRVSSASSYANTEPGRNILTNSDFANISVANTPTRWEAVVAAWASATLTLDATAYRTGGSAVKIIGNGSQLTGFRQLLNSGAGSIGQLIPHHPHTLTFMMRNDGSAPGAGVLRACLHDGSNVITGTDVSVTLSATNAAYTRYTVTFIAPEVLPAKVYVLFALTTAMTAAEYVLISDIQLIPLVQAGEAGAWYFCAVQGAVNFVKEDTFTIDIANNWVGKILKGMERLFNMRALGLQLPTDDPATIDDGLVA